MSLYHEDSFLPVQRIVSALSKARHLLTADMHAAFAGTGVGSSHVGALLLLSLGIACTSVGLSRLLGVDPGFVTRIIDRLESQGLVRRDRDNPDRRVVNLTLTEAGRNVAARIAEIVPAVLNRRQSGFTPLEFAALSSLLGRLVDE
ncbi:MarR family winged helix-turn-helix transcriptional regulator [Paraburkholderia sp. BL10I2N1]|uniref:MarR family winged helix-turn-helix transcriptional regulator n=1 Tax=Paraburkholderia sp. BL10I2N1 TaxID=1938796 RepID=UPI00105E4EE4|nr:MarR family winged helix-turn-helix transcriptional regulator [Paraburkholderia sp. BL10I2N1]TDN62011.1 DNA-binding MarR family transcriptional regulator [Paraburkholderia sp. BL10I2N1]